MSKISELAARLDAAPPEARVAQQAILDDVWHSGDKDNAKQRAELGQQLVSELAGKHKPTANIKLAEYASLAAGDAQVDELLKIAENASDPHTAQMARWALDRLHGGAAAAALVKLAEKGKSLDSCVGAINALANRAGPGVVDVLIACAADKEIEVALAAGEALANVPDPTLDKTIASIKAESDRAKLRVAKARIRLGETLAKDGSKEAARKVFQAVIDGDADEVQKRAAKKLMG